MTSANCLSAYFRRLPDIAGVIRSVGDFPDGYFFFNKQLHRYNGFSQIKIVDGNVDAAAGAMTEWSTIVVSVTVVIVITRLHGHYIFATIVAIAAGSEGQHGEV